MNRPRVVLDTNVLISSLWGGTPGKIVRLWQKGGLRALLSREILEEEYMEVLSRFHPAEEDLDTFVALMGSSHLTEWIAPPIHLHVIQSDPSDNRFLECAVAGHADALVSGDKHLLDLKQYEGIPILTPTVFLNRFPISRI